MPLTSISPDGSTILKPGWVNQQYSASLESYVNTTTYNLTPSGDTTGVLDTKAIQALLNTTGLVSLGTGTFYINSTLSITANGVTLQGSGAGATILKATSAIANSVVIQVGNGSVTTADTVIRNLMIDSVSQKTGAAGIDINKCLRTRVTNIRTYHQYSSIHVHNSTATWISECDLRDQTADGIEFDCDLGAGYDLYITNVLADNRVVSNSGNGINWTGGENLVIHNCDFLHFAVGLMVNPGSGRQCRWGFFNAAEFDTNSDNNWKLTNGTGDIAGLTFTNCWSGTATNYGVLIDGSGGGGILAGIRLNSCKIVHNGIAGIRLISGATQVSITDCDIISNSQANSGVRSGIEVTAGTQQFIIEGCQITNGLGQGSTQANGISFDSGATDYFIITNNNLHGNTNTAINNLSGVTGTHQTVTGNLT